MTINNFTNGCPLEEFRMAMTEQGIEFRGNIIADGKIHRFADITDTLKKQSCWYVFFGMAGAFGNWKQDIKIKWSSKQTLSKKEKIALTQQIELTQQAINKEVEERNQQTSHDAQTEWDSLSKTGDASYLESKGVSPFGIRFGKNDKGIFIAIPLFDSEGKLWNLQRIFDDGKKRFLYGGRKKGCFHLLGTINDKDPVYIVEGYSTGASIHQATESAVVIAFDAGNLEPVVKALRNKYPQTNFIIAGDDDRWNLTNIGRHKAEEAARKYQCKVVFPAFKNDSSKPTDFNDLYALEGIETVERQLLENVYPLDCLPEGYVLKEEGLFYKDKWIASSIQVIGMAKDTNSENWSKIVAFKDPDKKLHRVMLPMALLGSDKGDTPIADLLSKGLKMERSSRSALLNYLMNAGSKVCATCVVRTGWHDNKFVLPHQTFSESSNFIFQKDPLLEGYQERGTLEAWQEKVAAPCDGNSRLIFSLCCAFAAPLLKIMGTENIGFNLRGASSIGKSTALAVAASVWGSPHFTQQWRTTGNALEVVAESRNDALLCLDELGQVDGKEVGEIAYMLANGAGKNRLSSRAEIKKRKEWRLLFLSTGEVSITDKMQEDGGKRPRAGMVVRIVDIPADANTGHGLFDTIHDFNAANELALHLKEATAQYYGTPILEFIRLLQQSDKKDLKTAFQKCSNDFLQRHKLNNVDGQVKRVANAFGVIAAAGELAIEFKILPFGEGAALSALSTCFLAWLRERGNTKSFEVTAGLHQVRSFLETQTARFATTKSHTINNLAGYKKTDSSERTLYYIFSGVFQKEVCKGFDHRIVCGELVKQRLLERDNDRQFTQNTSVQGVRGRYYVINSSIFDVKEDDE